METWEEYSSSDGSTQTTAELLKALGTSLALLSASHFLLLYDGWMAWGVRPLTGADLPEAVFAQCGWIAKVLQAGQEWEVDWGRVDDEWKRKHLKDSVRGAAEDVAREWMINAYRT